MSSLIRTQYNRVAVREAQSKLGYVHCQAWTAPLAANPTAVLNAANLASGGTLTTFAAQPDKPRNLTYVASGATTANVTVNGVDIRGVNISETVALNGATPVNGVKAFASVTSIVLPTVAATTLNVGTGVLFGLDRLLPAKTVIGYYVDGTSDSGAPTVAFNAASGAISNNTISWITAPNGAHNYLVAIISQELTTAKGTTS